MAELKRIGNFDLLEKIGQGGMGAVFKARQLSMDRVVALKILPPKFAAQKTFIERFVREARASAKLNHPNIVNGIDVGQDNGVYYFAMEYIEGCSVKELLKKGPLHEAEAVDITRSVALALVHAHSHGILHRDIKPDNILIEKNGIPKLCDLGLARVGTETEDEDKNAKQQGHAVGTPHYISPEQARGRLDADERSDLYSLGASMYHMLSGHTMFDSPDPAVVMTKHMTEKALHPCDHHVRLSKDVLAVLSRLVIKDRDERYESAEKLAEDLDRLRAGQPLEMPEVPANKSPFKAPARPVTHPEPAAKKMTVTTDKHRILRRDRSGSRAGSLPLAAAAVGAIIVIAIVAINASQNSAGGRSGAYQALPRVAPRAESIGFRKPVPVEPAKPKDDIASLLTTENSSAAPAPAAQPPPSKVASPEISDAALEPGLWAEYYDTGADVHSLSDRMQDRKLKTARIDRQINYTLSNVDFAGSGLKERLYAKWTGLIRIAKPGRYTFHTLSGDGSRLFIRQKKVVDNDGRRSQTGEKSGEIELAAGDHEFTVEMFCNQGPACVVSWETIGKMKQVLPADVLFHRPQKK
jgi:serine/threonine protein kinase